MRWKAGELAAQRGREAHEAKAWAEAYSFYRAAEEAGKTLGPDDLERMAMDAWLIGEQAADTFARACDAFESEGRVHDAVRVAADVSDYHGVTGDLSQAQGWARRTMRLLEDAPEGPGHARVSILRGFLMVLGGELDGALDMVEKGHALARKYGDGDAEALALSRRAALLMRRGRVEEATADVDEAMLLVNRDRTRPVTGAMIYCNTIDFCRNLGDFERALEWTEAAGHWIDQRQVCGFPGLCRVHRAELLRLRGEHERAATELRAAIQVFEKHRFAHAFAYALTELGHLRLETSALDAAEQAFREADELGFEPLPGLALLALERGDAAEARALLDGKLGELTASPLGRAKLLPTLVTACIELDDLDAAQVAVDELAASAEQFGTLGIEAEAHTAAARLDLARGDGSSAVRSGRNATRAWRMLGACYELARARSLLADAYEVVGDVTRAKIERSRVRATLDSMRPESVDIEHARPAVAETIAAAPSPIPPPLARSVPIRVGHTLGEKIEVGPVLGVGGMGVVHRGKHLITGRDVAIKVLKRTACGDPEHCRRFLSEARACGRIKHENVVDIYDAGMHGDEPYIVMELLEGRSLETILADGEALSLERVLEIGEGAARGVAAAHAAGVIHRDLKPGNIFVTSGPVKVLDFGISKQPEGGETRPDQILGTPFYMAPEQIRRPSAIDGRTDVYALGAVLFELLTGEPPFVADVVHALLYAITNGPEPKIRDKNPDVPDAVEKVVMQALAREQDERFASAVDLADALAELRGEPLR